LGKIVPRYYRTFQYRKCLVMLRDGSQEGEHVNMIDNQGFRVERAKGEA
jgi:hypothetical protein